MMIYLGIYEKALPKNKSIFEHLKIAKELGFNFYEISIDETDERLSRLDWSTEKRRHVIECMFENNIKIQSMCLSGHRRFPFGSSDIIKRKNAEEIMYKAIDLASDLGIRVIQLAGYDVYYEDKSNETDKLFIEGIKKATNYAAKKQVTLAIEIMDDTYINSITKFLKIKSQIDSPFLQVYPDIGNLSAWPENDVNKELKSGIQNIVSVHLKDTLKVTESFPGKFKEVAFGDGCVDFQNCFKVLEKLGYQGSFLIEMWSENSEKPIDQISQAKTFILNELKESGAYSDEY